MAPMRPQDLAKMCSDMGMAFSSQLSGPFTVDDTRYSTKKFRNRPAVAMLKGILNNGDDKASRTVDNEHEYEHGAQLKLSSVATTTRQRSVKILVRYSIQSLCTRITLARSNTFTEPVFRTF